MEEILTVFGINWKLMAIQIINFGLLLFLLHRFLYRPLLRILEQRRVMAIKAVEDAKKTEAALKAADEEKRQILIAATRKAEETLQTAKTEASARKKAILQEAAEKSRKVLEDANRRAEQDRKRALDAASGDIARVAVLAAEKILRQKRGEAAPR